MNRFIIVILALVMAGCATTLTEEEATEACPDAEETCLSKALEDKVEQKVFEGEYNRGIDIINWENCARIYNAMGWPTYHVGHSHDRGAKKRRVFPEDVRSDLMHNHCRSIIRQAYGKDGWARHY